MGVIFETYLNVLDIAGILPNVSFTEVKLCDY